MSLHLKYYSYFGYIQLKLEMSFCSCNFKLSRTKLFSFQRKKSFLSLNLSLSVFISQSMWSNTFSIIFEAKKKRSKNINSLDNTKVMHALLLHFVLYNTHNLNADVVCIFQFLIQTKFFPFIKRIFMYSRSGNSAPARCIIILFLDYTKFRDTLGIYYLFIIIIPLSSIWLCIYVMYIFCKFVLFSNNSRKSFQSASVAYIIASP